MKYQAPVGATDPDAPYVGRDTPGAVRGSAVPPLAIEDPQREVADFISKSGFTPAEATLQLSRSVQTGKVNFAEAGGTANALTATLAPVPAALTPGMTIRLKIASNNTGAATLNVNSTGLVSIVGREGGALNADDLVANDIVVFTFDTTRWIYHGRARGALLNVRVFNTAGTSTYVPTPGTRECIVHVAGGGGSGGGAGSSGGAGLSAIGGGGGGGAGAIARFSVAALTGQTITVGAGGAATIAAAVDGNNGGASSIGTAISASGGFGGQAGLSVSYATPRSGPAQNGGTTVAGGNIIQSTGKASNPGFAFADGNVFSGTGGDGPFLGGGGAGVGSNSPGFAATGPGGGGGGGTTSNSATSRSGGAGAAGIVLIYEYA